MVASLSSIYHLDSNAPQSTHRHQSLKLTLSIWLYLVNKIA